jgi:hypothetical protein
VWLVGGAHRVLHRESSGSARSRAGQRATCAWDDRLRGLAGYLATRSLGAGSRGQASTDRRAEKRSTAQARRVASTARPPGHLARGRSPGAVEARTENAAPVEGPGHAWRERAVVRGALVQVMLPRRAGQETAWNFDTPRKQALLRRHAGAPPPLRAFESSGESLLPPGGGARALHPRPPVGRSASSSSLGERASPGSAPGAGPKAREATAVADRLAAAPRRRDD